MSELRERLAQRLHDQWGMTGNVRAWRVADDLIEHCSLLPEEREPNGCCIVCVEAVTNNCEYICERCCGEVAHSWHNGREP